MDEPDERTKLEKKRALELIAKADAASESDSSDSDMNLA